MKTDKLKRWLIVAVIAAWALWNPTTRSIILIILPLGSGVDDLVFFCVLVAGGVIGTIYYLKKRKENDV